LAKRTLFKQGTKLNSFLSTMNEEDKKEWGEGVFKALRAKSARAPDNPTVQGTMWSQRNEGRSTEVAAIMDSGCTHPLTTLTVTKAIKMEITPLTRELEIVEGWWSQVVPNYVDVSHAQIHGRGQGGRDGGL
jgi:hypothetical protein